MRNFKCLVQLATSAVEWMTNHFLDFSICKQCNFSADWIDPNQKHSFPKEKKGLSYDVRNLKYKGKKIEVIFDQRKKNRAKRNVR